MDLRIWNLGCAKEHRYDGTTSVISLSYGVFESATLVGCPPFKRYFFTNLHRGAGAVEFATKAGVSEAMASLAYLHRLH